MIQELPRCAANCLISFWPRSSFLSTFFQVFGRDLFSLSALFKDLLYAGSPPDVVLQSLYCLSFLSFPLSLSFWPHIHRTNFLAFCRTPKHSLIHPTLFYSNIPHTIPNQNLIYEDSWHQDTSISQIIEWKRKLTIKKAFFEQCFKYFSIDRKVDLSVTVHCLPVLCTANQLSISCSFLPFAFHFGLLRSLFFTLYFRCTYYAIWGNSWKHLPTETKNHVEGRCSWMMQHTSKLLS